MSANFHQMILVKIDFHHVIIQIMDHLDGHGGCFSCEIANTYLLDTFIEELSKLSRPFNSSLVIETIRDTFQKCDDLILQESVRVSNLNVHGMSDFFLFYCKIPLRSMSWKNWLLCRYSRCP